ncbi:MAG: RHS repeat protein [Anaerolineae bacterium]|nr:RHS repeat protein [Anaerolineae bacterium]
MPNRRPRAYEPVFSRPISQTNALGHTSLFEYDNKGQLTKTTDPLGHSTVYTYNTIGKMISTTNALGFTTIFTYDGVDLVAQQDPLGRVIRYFVDTGGRTVQVTDRWRRTRSEFGPQNLMTKATDAQGNMTQMAYDLNGNLLSVTDARNNITRFDYDSSDRVITRTDPLLAGDTYAYDLNGNMTQMKDRKGQATTMQYDLLNRRTQATFADGGVITYTYDLVSRVQAITDTASGPISHSYDALDRLTSETTPQGAVSYGYDLIGRRTAMTVTNDATTLYAYDNASRLTSMSKGAGTVTFGYDNAHRRTSTTLPNGIVQNYGFDNASQTQAMTYTLGAATIGTLSYGYDNAGQRVQMGGSFARTGLPQPIASASYDAGNRQLTWGTKTLTYDANGNMTNDGTNTYGWNARNQLTSMTGSLSASFGYDAKNRRVNRTVNSVSVGYLHDGDNPVQEITGSATNIWAGKTDEFFQRGNQTMLRDALGSVIGLADANGAIVTQYTYEPFGLASVSGAASDNPFQFTSRENDGTGLYFYRARYFAPKLGRFISRDPLGFGAGPNFYAYVDGDPVNKTDPMGLCAAAASLPPLGCIVLLDGTVWCPPEPGEWPEIKWPQKPEQQAYDDGEKDEGGGSGGDGYKKVCRVACAICTLIMGDIALEIAACMVEKGFGGRSWEYFEECAIQAKVAAKTILAAAPCLVCIACKVGEWSDPK